VTAVVEHPDAPSSGPASSEVSLTFRLAIPLAAQQLGFQLMGVVDTAMLGRWSDSALAGAGVGNTLLFSIAAIGWGIVMGLDTVVPQALGAGRPDDARRYLDGGLRLAVLVGIAATLAVVLSPALLTVADVDPDIAREAKVYLYARSLGIVPFMLTIAYRSVLAAHHSTRVLVIAVIGGNVANAILDLALIYGAGLGVLGAATATVVVQVASLWLYIRAVRALEGPTPRPRSTTADLKLIAGHGWPVGGQMFAEIGVFGLATVLAAHLGKLPAAGHSIALNIASFTFSATVGIGAATAVRVGHAVGRGDLALARRRGMIGLVVGLATMSVFALTFLAIPAGLARLFTNDPAVVASTVPLLQIAALFQLSDGTQAIASGALRGLGDNRATLVANLIGHYGVGLAISLSLAFSAGMGAPGLWWGLSAGLTVTALILVARFVRSTNRSSR
jgi:MATE family multidrug resistance protein